MKFARYLTDKQMARLGIVESHVRAWRLAAKAQEFARKERRLDRHRRDYLRGKVPPGCA